MSLFFYFKESGHMKIIKHIVAGVTAALFLTVALPAAVNAAVFYRSNHSGILQTQEDDRIEGQYYVPSTIENIYWGRLPNKYSKPILTVPSGSTITFDTISHEGLLEDQGKNPVQYFGQYGVSEKDVLKDALQVAQSSLKHDFDADGPHIVTGPIAIEGALPGDVLKVEVLSLTPRVPYGVISNRHYKGALPGEFPEGTIRKKDASFHSPEDYGNISKFMPIAEKDGIWYSYFETNGKKVQFPINPFLGIMGVATNTEEMLSSIPPLPTGGNLDINELGIGSTLYLPVEVEGGMFFTGDPHFAQGDGEVALTALEGSLRGTVRLTVLKKGSSDIPRNGDAFTQAFGETEQYWIPIGLNTDLDEAMKQSVRESIDFLSEQLGIDRAMAYAYLSAAVDYEVSQVVDKTKGIHALIPKVDFYNLLTINLSAGETLYPVQMHNNGFYVPVDVLKNLNATVAWNKSRQAATVKKDGKTFVLKVESNTYLVDGKKITTTSAPLLNEGKMLIPVSSLNDVLGVSVNWSTVGRTIKGIVTP